MEPTIKKLGWTSVIVFGLRWRATFAVSIDGRVQVDANAEEGQAILCERNIIKAWTGCLWNDQSVEDALDRMCQLYGGRIALRDNEDLVDESEAVARCFVIDCIGDDKVLVSPTQSRAGQPINEAMNSPGAEDVVAEAEQAVTDDLANEPTCFVTDCMSDRLPGSRLCEGHQDLVVADVEPEMTGQSPEQLRARAMTLLARANVQDEETHGRDLDAAGRTLTDWGDILEMVARGCRDEAYGGGSLQWLADELSESGYPAESVERSFPLRTRQQIVDGEINVFALDLLFKSAEKLLSKIELSRIAGTTDFRGNRWQWSVELLHQLPEETVQ